jgi:ComF family protein
MEDRNRPICNDCFKSIKLNNTLFCPVCRARLAENKKICHFDSPYLLAAAASYDDTIVQNLIHYFKYKSFGNLAVPLSEIIVKYLENIFHVSSSMLQDFILVPVPLHFWREKKRGFNQSRLLAENLSTFLNIPLADCLKRIKNTQPQAKAKNGEERIGNIAGCFAMKNPAEVAGKNIILIDDVFTSGATMNEAVKVLKSARAKKIIALTLAKA